MAASNFERALSLVLESEGGFVDDPADSGGATNLGITQGTLSAHLGRRASVKELRALTRASAALIYRTAYWDKVAGDDLSAGLDYAVFDLAVNSGPGRAARLLQRVLRCPEDGVVGPVTVAASCRSDPAECIRRLSAARLSFLRRLPSWAFFARGWRRRVMAVERAALALCGSGPAPARSVRPSAPTPARAGSWAWFRSLVTRSLHLENKR